MPESLTKITPTQLHELRQRGESVNLIDVRTPAEYAQIHIPGAKLYPLDQIKSGELMVEPNGKTTYVTCRTGRRATEAINYLRGHGVDNLVLLDGGTQAWTHENLPVVGSGGMSLERQVRIGAGALVLIGAALGALVHPGFYALSAFVGAGLLFAGLTDWCGMAMLLAKMPWNRRK